MGTKDSANIRTTPIPPKVACLTKYEYADSCAEIDSTAEAERTIMMPMAVSSSTEPASA